MRKTQKNTHKKTDKPIVKMGIAQVAELAGVSKTTVSMVLSNYGGISSETSSRVLDCVHQLGYIPKPRKQSSRAKRKPQSSPIAFVVCGSSSLDTNPYYLSIASGAMDVVKTSCSEMTLAHWSPDEMESFHLPDCFSNSRVSGVILTGQCSKNNIAPLAKLEIPITLAQISSDADGYDTICEDSRGSVRQAYGHLHELGHRNIVALVADINHIAWKNKQAEFLHLTSGEGDNCGVINVHTRPFNDYWTELQTRFPKTTAILATSDYLGLVLLSGLHQLGIRCPQDISIVGIDGMDSVKTSSPPLTTVDTDQKAMGNLAVRKLLERISYPHTPYATITPRPKLILRDSCMPMGL